MNVFFTSDLHLGHDAIRRHCSRPWNTVEEMDEALIDRWNKTVTSKDIIYIAGDFAWRHHTKYISHLKGKKILIRGNHDAMPQIALKQFTEVHVILDRVINKQRIVICHYPMRSWSASVHGSWHLFGHCHGRLPTIPRFLAFDIGVDVWDFTPVPWEAIKLKMEFLKSQQPLSYSSEELEKNIKIQIEENRYWRSKVS